MDDYRDDIYDIDLEDYEIEEVEEVEENEEDKLEKYVQREEVDTFIDNDINKVDKDYLEYINDDIIFNSENINTTKYITLYEKTIIIGQRAEDLKEQYNKKEFMPFIEITKDMINKYNELDFMKIAEKEFEKKKTPYFIKRYLPNNKYVIVDVIDLEIKDKY